MMQKTVQNSTPDTKASFNVKMGGLLRGKISLSKLVFAKC